MQLLTIFAIIFTIGGVLFAMQNNIPVMVSFALWQFEGSLALVLLISLALGALIAALVSTPTTVRMQWRISRQRSRIASLEKNNKALERKLSELELSGRADQAVSVNTSPTQYAGLKQLITGESPHWRDVDRAGESLPHSGASKPKL
jgi:uncharacterized integral membrane protein